MNIALKLAEELKLNLSQVESTIKLIDEGNTIPFIARYRKEVTGSLDDQVLRELDERLSYLRSLEKRKEEVRAGIEAAGKLTDELTSQIEAAETLARLEDIYRPYKPKRRTRGMIAREKGLEPLAAFIMEQQRGCKSPIEAAAAYIKPGEVDTAEDALQGALDIIAEDVSDDSELRLMLKEYLTEKAVIIVKGEDEQGVYAMYNDYSEGVRTIPGHRILAIDRGEREGKLKVKLDADMPVLQGIVCNQFVKMGSPCTKAVMRACDDSLSRLILPSVENELRNMLTERASEQAIKVFSLNLRQLLMQPPVKGQVTLGLDPGYRTGCKLAVVDDTGRVLDTGVIYPTPPQNRIEDAKKTVKSLIEKYNISLIAIGNGTASRESESFVATLIKEIDKKVQYLVVSEAGASVYSASKLAAEEFPDYDVSLRSAVSIARRLQDPLAELVKIDPKSIGVGQYQHDLPAAHLSDSLTGVVEDCVNSVGVDLDTASFSLLSYVSGINKGLAKSIVAYREENGAFKNRKELMKVPKLGKKAFEQAAGFLRIPGSADFLDSTGVHPESYDAAKKLLKLCGYQRPPFTDLRKRAEEIGFAKLCAELSVGAPTLNDIIDDLMRPGRDPRDNLAKPLLRSDVLELSDLTVGMELTGTVRNVTDFGAFVDIGLHDDGLIHISKMSKTKRIKHPSEVLKVGDIVTVCVERIEKERGRVGLSLVNS